METFTPLAQYEDCWPVRDLLKLKLKATSEKERNQGGRNALNQVSSSSSQRPQFWLIGHLGHRGDAERPASLAAGWRRAELA